jgi:hypothetical protein
MHRIVSLLAVLLVASTTALVAPADAAAVAATATGVSANAWTSCSDNPSFDISGSTVGDGYGSDGWGTVAGETAPTPEIIPSPLYDDWNAAASDWGIVFPADAPVGTVRGLYATVGTPDLDPATSIEWFLLYECAAAGSDSFVLATCFGPVGTCPRSVDEALAFEASVAPTDPRPASQVAVSMTGCAGGQVVALLFDDAEVELAQTDPGPGALGGVVQHLTVPSDVLVGAPLHVLAVCSIDGVAPVRHTLVVSANDPATTTTTVAPPGVTPPAARTPAAGQTVGARFAG